MSSPSSPISSSASSPISFGGLVSGLSTAQIVTALTSASQARIDQMKARDQTEQSKLAAYQDLNVKLSTLQAAASSLGLQGTIGAKTVSFAGPSGSYATGIAKSSAVPGSFQLEIDQLATATKVTSTSNIGVAIALADPVISSKTSTNITAGTFTVNGKSISVTAGESFQTLFTAINTATSGAVSGAIVGDAVQLTSASPISLGAGGDTSNFLAVTHLAGQPAATTMTSSGPVGVANPTLALNSANLSGLTSTTTGSLVINGVTVNYNTTVDTLNDVSNRINASAAGVTASYDPNADKLTLTSTKTGNIDMTVSDGNGTLAAAFKLTLPAAHQLGSSASYRVNGGPLQYSLTNTVQNIQPGVDLTFTAPTPSGSPITVAVAQDLSSASASIQTFAAAYNAVVDLIKTDTAYDPQTKTAGILFGDPTLDTIQSQLNDNLFISHGRSLGLTPPYTDLSVIGLSTGAVGSPVGSTTHLTLNSAKFQAALTANPAAVGNLVNTVFKQFNTVAMSLTAPGGAVDAAVQAENSIIKDDAARISFQNKLLQQQTDFYNQEFTQLEITLSQLRTSSAAASALLASLAGSTAQSTSSSRPTTF